MFYCVLYKINQKIIRISGTVHFHLIYNTRLRKANRGGKKNVNPLPSQQYIQTIQSNDLRTMSAELSVLWARIR